MTEFNVNLVMIWTGQADKQYDQKTVKIPSIRLEIFAFALFSNYSLLPNMVTVAEELPFAAAVYDNQLDTKWQRQRNFYGNPATDSITVVLRLKAVSSLLL